MFFLVNGVKSFQCLFLKQPLDLVVTKHRNPVPIWKTYNLSRTKARFFLDLSSYAEENVLNKKKDTKPAHKQTTLKHSPVLIYSC